MVSVFKRGLNRHHRPWWYPWVEFGRNLRGLSPIPHKKKKNNNNFQPISVSVDRRHTHPTCSDIRSAVCSNLESDHNLFCISARRKGLRSILVDISYRRYRRKRNGSIRFAMRALRKPGKINCHGKRRCLGLIENTIENGRFYFFDHIDGYSGERHGFNRNVAKFINTLYRCRQNIHKLESLEHLNSRYVQDVQKAHELRVFFDYLPTNLLSDITYYRNHQ